MLLVGVADHVAGQAGLLHRRVQRALQRQPDGRRGRVEFHGDRDFAGLPLFQRAALDAAQDVNHPAVLDAGLVVEEPPELFGELADRRLGALRGIQPVVVNVPQPGVPLGDPGQGVHPIQQAGQLLLTRLGQQETVERLERSGPDLGRLSTPGCPAHRPAVHPCRHVRPGDLLAEAGGRTCRRPPPPRGSRPAAPGRCPRTARCDDGPRSRRAWAARPGRSGLSGRRWPPAGGAARPAVPRDQARCQRRSAAAVRRSPSA